MDEPFLTEKQDPRDRRASQCAGKVRHETQGDAKKALRRMGVRGVEAFRCNHCHGWHIGRIRGLGIRGR